ncbi:hypothetical protein PsorP6_008013 [Peronosclerospora sorghi]|uniref:Uncharacterized protein n=1 Tax=Peronosclerospora sorghi TaxID=230839 RepID=A0ACC0W7S2_9STRA|nr:hypothetical protein PsorP6_008013 [Peronosclerospora sorghi]
MVATPTFHVSQDPTWVFVHVHVPFVRVSEMEFHVDGTDFTFFCKPYLLKLRLPHEVVDNDVAKAVYDPNKDHGTIVVHLPKKEPGQDFPDLDMLTKLLQPQRRAGDMKSTRPPKAPLIEVLESAPVGNFQEELNTLNALIDGEPVFCDNQDGASEKVPTDSSLLNLKTSVTALSHGSMKLDAQSDASESFDVHITARKPLYGFNNAYSDFFRVWHGEVSEILSLPDPDHTQPDQRRILREAAEEQQFDIERYLMDFANQGDDMYFDLAMNYVPFWRKYPVLSNVAPPTVDVSSFNLMVEVDSDANRLGKDVKQLSLDTASSSVESALPIIFTDEEKELLRRLPRKEFLLPEGSPEENVVLGGLVDILIAFAYEQLTTQGESGVESTWTVSIVSSTLSWLDSTSDLQAVVRSSIRRMITFPFLRQYDLAQRSVREAIEILKRGKRVVLLALLTLYRIVEKSETQYLLNSLYIQDYCVWIQSVTDERVLRISVELDALLRAFTKSKTGWALEELERSLSATEGVASQASDSDSHSTKAESSSEEETSDDDRNDEEVKVLVATM